MASKYFETRIENVTIVERKFWLADDVYRMCNEHDFYDFGTAEEYDAMLDMVSELQPTIENVYKIAKDIYEHTDWGADFENLFGTEDNAIAHIMYNINEDVIRTTYDVHSLETSDIFED